MLDQEKFKRKLLMRALLSAQSMVPLTVGLLALMVMGFIGIKALPLFILGVGGLILGAAAGLKRLMLPNEKMIEQIMTEISREKAEADERRLNDLQRKLEADGDPRTDTLLMDLRNVMQSFRDGTATIVKTGNDETFGILRDADKLFDGCIHALEYSLFLHGQSLSIRDPVIRKEREAERDHVIEEIRKSVLRLSRQNAKVQEMRLRMEDDPASTLRSIREEMDTNLRITAEADRAMRGPSDDDYAKFEHHADTEK